MTRDAVEIAKKLRRCATETWPFAGRVSNTGSPASDNNFGRAVAFMHEAADELDRLAALHSSPVGAEPQNPLVGAQHQTLAGAEPDRFVDLVFGGSLPDATFVEVEDASGQSIRFGQWMQRADGYWVLRLPVNYDGVPISARDQRWWFQAGVDAAQHAATAMSGHRHAPACPAFRGGHDCTCGARHSTTSARPTPAAVPEQRNPAQDMRDAGILLAPKRAIPTED